MPLNPVAQADLDLMVADQLNQHIAVGQIFTAYDITQALRSANPTLQIEHPEVRQAVHAHMDALITSNLYQRETASFGGSSATRYVPQ